MRALRFAAIPLALIGAVELALGAPKSSGFSNEWAFTGGVLALVLLVYVAGGSARARGRFAAVALWLVLGGIALLLGAVGYQMAIRDGVTDVTAIGVGELGKLAALGFLWTGSLFGLVGGGLLWIFSRYLDKPRG